MDSGSGRYVLVFVKPQDAFYEDKVHRTSTIATSNVVFLSVDFKDLERTLHNKDMESLCKHVRMTASWREQRIQKAMQIMMAAKANFATPKTEVVPILRRNTRHSQEYKLRKLSNLFSDGKRITH